MKMLIKFWCGVLLLIQVFAKKKYSTMEKFNMQIFQYHSDFRESPFLLGNEINTDARQRFFKCEESLNEFCLSTDEFNKDDPDTCYYSYKSLSGKEQWDNTYKELNDGALSEGTDRVNWSDALAQAWYDHISLQGPSGQVGHKGTDGSSFPDRVNRYSSSYKMIAETLVYFDKWGSNTALEVMKGIAVDDGVSGSPHKSLLYDPQITHVGVSCGWHYFYGVVWWIGYGVNVANKNNLEHIYVGNKDVDNCTYNEFGRNEINSFGLFDDVKDDKIEPNASNNQNKYIDRSLVNIDQEPAIYSTIDGYTNSEGSTLAVVHTSYYRESALNPDENFEYGNTFEARAHKIHDEINNIRSNPDSYAKSHYSNVSKKYNILTSHKSVGNLDWDDTLAKASIAYVNNFGQWGGSDDGKTTNGRTFAEYFQAMASDYGYSVFGVLYGNYYIKSVQNVLDSIILQMGEEHLFNSYYNKFGMGWSWDIKDGFIWGYILSKDVDRNGDIDGSKINWSPVITQDTWSMLWANNNDAESEIGKVSPSTTDTGRR